MFLLQTKIKKRLALYPLLLILLFSSLQLKCQRISEQNNSLDLGTPVHAVKSSPSDSLPVGIRRLLKAYPDHFKGATRNRLLWKDGTAMLYNDDKNDKAFIDLLQNPDLEDQVMAMPYPKGDQWLKPQPKEDPGRVRYEPFFKKMYGASRAAVQQNLTTVIWLPKTFGIKLQVTKVNNIHLKLQELSNRLDTMPEFHKYLQQPGGTFNWRYIAGTKRLSLHSFGMTIDINIQYSNYWRWAIQGEDPQGNRIIHYKNQIPLALVALFESYGFIWGGKWYHYDTMHFEYRPELLLD